MPYPVQSGSKFTALSCRKRYFSNFERMEQEKYIAFLRGINVGGNHKLPMADLKKEVLKLGFSNPDTLLNSGNLVFEGRPEDPGILENKLSDHLKKAFGFPVPVLLRRSAEIMDLINDNPFAGAVVTPDTRLYCSFLTGPARVSPDLPWISPDGAFTILEVRDRTVCSVLDLRLSQTTKAMDGLEQMFGSHMTTRNYNTVQRIAEKWLIPST